jgi:hypothetical protein
VDKSRNHIRGGGAGSRLLAGDAPAGDVATTWPLPQALTPSPPHQRGLSPAYSEAWPRVAAWFLTNALGEFQIELDDFCICPLRISDPLAGAA